MPPRVYLDWNATAPPLAEVIDAMATAAREAWGNPASIHGEGRTARRLVEDARASVAELAGADPRDVVFTSGGTEANNLALRSLVAAARAANPSELPRIVTSPLEHPSVLEVARALVREGQATLRELAVRPDGRVDEADVARALEESPVPVVALQAVNHETGAIEPLTAILDAAKADRARVHVDAVQAWGKVQMSLIPRVQRSTRSLAGHKLRGPKGIGALIHPAGFRVLPVLRGGAQERGIRPGTVDPVAAAGLGVAARHALGGPARHAALRDLRDDLVRRLRAVADARAIAFDVVTPPADADAGHVANVAFAGIDGPELVAALDLEGVAVASGSACSAGTHEPSPGIAAIAGADRARRSVRLSLGETTTAADVARAAEAFASVLSRGARTPRPSPAPSR